MVPPGWRGARDTCYTPPLAPTWWHCILMLILGCVVLQCQTEAQGQHSGETDFELLDSSPPVFVIQPKPAYIIKTKPAELTCKAAHAFKVTFECTGDDNGKDRGTAMLVVHPQNGIRFAESQLEVDRETVEKYKEEGFSCHCKAWSSRGETTSKSAPVSIAFLRRHFIEPPYSQTVPLNAQLELRCIPPEGYPHPDTQWFKNDYPINLETNTNYKISSEGSLLILSTQLEDSGNFSCSAENVAAKRFSDVAVLKVFVDGAWAGWSSWSSCTGGCGRGVQRRTRTCTDPEPAHGGASCQGDAMQESQCSRTCPAENGSWSTWSTWSTCGADCRRHRRRSCDDPPPQFGGHDCQGPEFDSQNCTGGMCRGMHKILGAINTEQAREAALRQDITLIVVLAVLVALVLLLLVVFFRKFNRKSRQNGAMYEITSSDYPLPFYSDSSKNKKVRPTTPEIGNNVVPQSSILPVCYDHAYSEPTSNSSCGNKSVMGGVDNLNDEQYSALSNIKDNISGKDTPASEHHYDVPLINSSLDSPTSSETHHLLASYRQLTSPNHDPIVKYTRKFDSPMSSLEKSARSISPSSVTSDDSSGIHPSSGSEFSAKIHSDLPSLGVGIEGMTCRMIDSKGGRLNILDYGVSLMVPEGAIPPDMKQKVYIAVITHPKQPPSLTERQTLLSPIICCGPPGLLLLKPAVVSFEHCASLQHASWLLHILSSVSSYDAIQDYSPDSNINYRSLESQTDSWSRVLTLGEERIDTPLYAQIDGSQVLLMTNDMRQFAVVGESAGSNAAVKQVRVVVTAPSPSNDALTLTIHVLPDTNAALTDLAHVERRRGVSLLDKPKTLLLQDCGSNLCFTLDELGQGWKIRQGQQYQELSFESIWNSMTIATTTFILERCNGSSDAPVSCRIVTQQKGVSAHRQVSRINTDFPYAPVTASPLHPLLKSSTVTSSTGCSSTVSVDNDSAVFRLPVQVRRELCRCLDMPNARGNDWRMLAARLNVDRYLNYFACRNSPTEHILDLWEARHSEITAVTDLLNILRIMGRPDAARVLETHAGAWI